MKASSIFVAGLAIALPLSGMAQAATPSGAATSLPNVVVEAPKHIAGPQHLTHRAVTHSTAPHRTSSAIASASPMTPAERELAKLPNAITGSCVDGCVTSFRTGDRPWVGCSGSNGMLSSTCRNVGNYKTFNQCMTAGLATGWRSNETSWYCSSLALKD
jgi:hypothetical protein